MRKQPRRTSRFSQVFALLALTTITGLAITATTAGAAGVRFGFVESVNEFFGYTPIQQNSAEPMAQPFFATTTVFTDDFSTASSGFVTSGSIGGTVWEASRLGADWGARRFNNRLELSNDIGGTNANGWVRGTVVAAAFSSPVITDLSSNSGPVTWTFNMRQPRTDPAGFIAGSYGVAFILAGNNTTATSGAGYAVVLGNGGGTDPVRLVRYFIGLQGTMTELITSNTSGLTDFGTEHLSVKVTYLPSTNTWELFLRNDGGAFADPASGTLVSQGTVVDSTYTTGGTSYMGAYWQGSTATSQIAYFDNVSVAVDTVASSGNITMNGNNLPIANGSTTPSLANHTDFGSITVGASTSRGLVIGNGNATQP
ncbi:MAG: hypothetical protein ABL959_16725, partial [Pyrinomonadaceae bacterium]